MSNELRPSLAELAPPTVNGDSKANLAAILASPSYQLAEYDINFIKRDEIRPVRMHLELLKTETLLRDHAIKSTVVVFGSARIPPREVAEAELRAAQDAAKQSPASALLKRAVSRAESILAKSRYYEEARRFGQIVSKACQIDKRCDFVVTTGGGPGIMEAVNRGAFDIGCKSIGLNIDLPHEQEPNAYITPDLCFQFHYFAIRKFHFILRAKALVVFPGGYGTLDELFDTLCLRQTKRMQAIPIILYGREYWDSILDFHKMTDEGVVADEDLDLISYAETPEEAWQIIADFHHIK
jgi:uncharacterized protein (TIGR00730 family)